MRRPITTPPAPAEADSHARPRQGVTRRAVLALAASAFGSAAMPRAQAGEARHAIAMHGEPALPKDFTSFRYVNPNAPKGGRLVQGLIGTFDSLNPFVVKGLAPQAIRGYVIESLLTRGYDEPFTLYGLLARTVETDAARSYVSFGLDPAAMFSDGHAVTAQDVIFSWALLRDRGRPNYRTYYAKVKRAEALDDRTVRFDLAGSNDRELPLILGLMPILAKHVVDPDAFEETTMQPLLGTGPYVVDKVAAGKSLTLKRNPAYWGRNLAVNRGFWNFDEVRLDYYRDGNTQFEAFKKGLYDMRPESDPGRWETAYDFPAARQKHVLKESFETGLPKGMTGLVFNTRRPLFADVRVREALTLLFDFEWINKNFFFGAYRRTASYFEGSELSARGVAAGPRERALLAPFPNAVRPDILDGTWSPPKSDGSGRDRRTLRRALTLLEAAGYHLVGTQLRNRATGRAFAFEILVEGRDQERLALAYAQSLGRAGIHTSVRPVDAVQYDRRKLTFDFDMIQNRWDESLSPGNEQAFYWGSAAADEQGSRNYMGVKSAAVDAMIAALLEAQTRTDFVAAVRALDRVLMSGFYVVPLFHAPAQWVARWAYIRHPAATSRFGYLPETWWREP